MAYTQETIDQTAGSFDQKWTENDTLAFSETMREGSDIQSWILNRNGWQTRDDLAGYLSGKKRVLDAGCGNGRVTALLASHRDPSSTEVVGVDLVAHKIAQENLRDYKNVQFFHGDLTANMSEIGQFDFIYCQEVLHHTRDPQGGFNNLVDNHLQANGEIAIYVYRQKAPLREYTDDFVREKLKDMPYEEAMKHCDQLTELGKRLSELKVEFDAPEVEVLGIEAGRQDIQRFFYNAFCKCFWNPDLGFGPSSAINFDWYKPQICERYTKEQVEAWFEQKNLKILHSYVDPYGITIRGLKK